MSKVELTTILWMNSSQNTITENLYVDSYLPFLVPWANLDGFAIAGKIYKILQFIIMQGIAITFNNL